VIPGDFLVVTDGAARGDGLGFADDLVLDDVYQIGPWAPRLRLSVAIGPEGRLTVAPGSSAGVPGNRVHLDCCLTLMPPSGRPVEVVVLVETEGDSAVATIWALPLASLEAKVDYRLVGVDLSAATSRLAEVAFTSFAAGTRIALASGAQVPVEALRPGDRVLTRDDGAQPLRWVGRRTLRATGAFAPVVIRAGALHNAADLVLSPDHRILVYQRQDQLGAGRAEVLVKARHLVNGDDVVWREGGFIDYVQLLFDDHQLIFAEGIAAESLLIDPRTRAALPAGLNPHGERPHHAYEVEETLLSGANVVDLLRRASMA
jgi:hypothetical protein